MNAKVSPQELSWFHRCGICSHCFSAVELMTPCPNCWDDINRDTISHNLHLHEQYGTMTPEEWSTTLGIEDLANPVDTPEAPARSTPNPLFDKLIVHVGHKLEGVTYGESDEAPANVAVECTDCSTVLIDADKCDE